MWRLFCLVLATDVSLACSRECNLDTDVELEHVWNFFVKEGVSVCYKNATETAISRSNIITKIGDSLRSEFDCEYSALEHHVSDMFGRKHKSEEELRKMRESLYAEIVDNQTCLTKVHYEKETFPDVKFFFHSGSQNTSMYRQNYVPRRCELRVLYGDYKVFKEMSQDTVQVRGIIIILKEAKQISNDSHHVREHFMKETFKIDTLRPWLTNPYLFRLFGCWMNLEELNAEDFILRREEAPDTSHQTAANEESGSSDPQPIPNQESPTVVPILPEKNSEKENSVPSKEISTAVPFSEKEATTNVGLHQNVTQDETPQSNPSKHALIFSLLMLASCFIAFGFVGCVQTIYVEVGRDFLKKLKILK